MNDESTSLIILLQQTRYELGEVTGPGAVVELGLQDLVPGGPAGAAGAGQAEDEGAVGQARQSTGLNRSRTDLLEGEGPEELAEAFDPLVEQGCDRLRGAIPTGDAGAAGAQDYLHLGVGDPARENGTHPVDIVRDDFPGHHLVACLLGLITDQVAGGVVGLGAAVGYGQERDPERDKAGVLEVFGHGSSNPLGSQQRIWMSAMFWNAEYGMMNDE